MTKGQQFKKPMAKVIRFDDYIDAHTLKRQIVNNIDERNIGGQAELMLVYGGFEYGIRTKPIQGGLTSKPKPDKPDFE